MQLVVENVRAAGIVPVALGRQQRLLLLDDLDAGGDLRRHLHRRLDDQRPTRPRVFSSRGPVTVDGSNRMKPDIAAPGSNVRSSIPGGSLRRRSAAPAWPVRTSRARRAAHLGRPGARRRRRPDRGRSSAPAPSIRRPPRRSAAASDTNVFPNNTFGAGRIDALAMIHELRTLPRRLRERFDRRLVARRPLAAQRQRRAPATAQRARGRRRRERRRRARGRRRRAPGSRRRLHRRAAASPRSAPLRSRSGRRGWFRSSPW